MRSLALLLVAGSLAAADPDFAFAPQSFQLAGQIEFVLGDGRHPFVDEDRRRALVGLRLQAHGNLALLGYQDAKVERAVADSGEELGATLPQESAIFEDHARRDDPAQTALQVGLPLGKAPYRGLTELRGSVEIAYAACEPKAWETPVAKLKSDEALIDGRDDFEIAMVDDTDPNRVAFRLSPEARLAVLELEFHDAKGKVIATKAPRIDRRETKSGKRRRQPASGRDDVLAFNLVLPADATVTVRYYPAIERRRVPFTLGPIAFGVVVPDAASVRAAAQRGADDL
jgi:hypothetical protein